MGAKLVWKLGVIVVLAAALGGVLYVKSSRAAAAQRLPAAPTVSELPRLLELGSVDCIPCKQMAPILDELRGEYSGRLAVDFIDVKKDEHWAQVYGIDTIPTQIMFDGAGSEVFRHIGYYPKADLVAKMAELGMVRPG